MKIIFEEQAFAKWKAYINSIDYEISGFGKVEKKDENLLISDIRIFQQVVTGGNTVLEAQALALFWDELIQAGEDTGLWKLWWHSHVDMQAQFSGTDISTIEDFDMEVPNENWMLSIVANKKGEALARIDVFEPIRCTINRVPIDMQPENTQLEINVKAEIDEKVIIRSHKHQETAEGNNRISFSGKNVGWHVPMLSRQERALLLTATYGLTVEQALDQIDKEENILDGEIIYDRDGQLIMS